MLVGFVDECLSFLVFIYVINVAVNKKLCSVSYTHCLHYRITQGWAHYVNVLISIKLTTPLHAENRPIRGFDLQLNVQYLSKKKKKNTHQHRGAGKLS